jgi:small ligand-binding sensory domain FIST
MRWSSTLSEKLATVDAVAEAAAATDAGLGGARADLVVVFASSTHTFGEIPRRLRDRFPHARILGCSAGGVIGGGREAEGRPALSVTAASLPAVDLRSLHVRDGGELPTLEGSPHFVLLADPFTCDIEGLVGALDEAYPEARKVGGLASGGGTPGSTALFLDDEILDEGQSAWPSAATSPSTPSWRRAAAPSASRSSSPAASATSSRSWAAAPRSSSCASSTNRCRSATARSSAARSTSASR